MFRIAIMLFIALFTLSCEPHRSSEPPQAKSVAPVDIERAPRRSAPRPEPRRWMPAATTDSPSMGRKCNADVVWDFVAEFDQRFPGCSGRPSDTDLRAMSCAEIDMALLSTGCFPEDAYVTGRSRQVSDIVEAGAHPCRQADGSVPERGKAHVVFRSTSNDEFLGCVPSAESCRASKICREDGKCSAGPTTCYAKDDSDCHGSEVCGRYGACYAIQGSCKAPCKQTLDGVNQPLFDRGYIASDECVPRARKQQSCKTSAACNLYGLCTNDNGYCVAKTDADCRRSKQCEEEGKCVITGSGECEVLLDRDCRESKACQEEGKCAVLGGECVDDKALKEADVHCKEGQELIDGKCRYPAGFDCTNLERCSESGKCRAYVDQNCDSTGVCSTRFAHCVVTDAYCRAQPKCEEEGICAATGRGWWDANKCYAVVFKGGTRSKHKRIAGATCGGYYYGGCTKTRAGCADSKACKEEGRCSAASPSSYCRPSEPKHCEQSEACKKYGYCGLVGMSTYHTCRVTEPEHCKQSQRCKEEGFCHFQHGVCEKAEDLR